MQRTLGWSSRIAVACAASLGVVGCGDDGGGGSGSDTETGGTTMTTTSSTTDPGSSSGDTMDATSTTDEPTGTSTTGTGTDGTGTDGGSTGGANTDPEALDDLYLTNTGTATLSIDANTGVLANDMDADGDTLSVDSSDNMSTAGGTVVVNADGSFDYTPPVGFFGDDRFGYVATDGVATAAAEVRIMVAPTLEDGGDASVLIDGEGAGDRSGHAVGGGFDINGDGIEDVLIGASEADGGAGTEGKAYAVFGPSGTVMLSQVAGGAGGFELIGRNTDGLTGRSVSILGDVNGDGLADLAIGAPDEGGTGEAYVVFGKADGTDVSLEDVAGGTGGFVINGAAVGDQFGYSIAAAGDVNGDGLADVIVGAPQDDPDEGYAVVVYGKATTTAVSIGALGASSGLGFVLAGAGAYDQTGFSVGGAGDTNNDGFDDVLVGANFADPAAGNQAGRVYVVLGSASDANVSLATVAGGTGGYPIDGEAGLDQSGESVAGAGDVNGDGRADILVGAPGFDPPNENAAGRSYVIFGKDDTNAVSLATVAMGTGGFAITGESMFNFLGTAVAAAGDVNADGFADVLVGASNAASSRGRAYLVYGGTSTAERLLTEVVTGVGGYGLAGEGSSQFLGFAVSSAGDVNGDGFDDILAGAFQADPAAGSDAGRSYILYGGDYYGLTAGDATAGDDMLVGDTSANYIVGGLGADVIAGGGGNDVLRGGPGDDTIDIPGGGDFFRLDGGTGDDTLLLSGNGVTLDLTAFPELAITGFETLDITGAGDNSLVLNLRDVRALSPTSNTVTVIGDAGDTLNADLQSAGFANQGSVGGFTTYSNGVLTLVVDDDITDTVQI